MGFLLYDIGFLIVFTLFIIIFLHKKRKNLKREGILYLYRTKVGVRFIDYIGKKHKRALNVLQYISIALGYVLMVGIFYVLLKAAYIYLRFPEITKFIKAPPIIPLIPYFPRIFGVQSFFPDFYFTYFIIVIVIVATVHEFAHGIFAKAKNLRIKSTGFAFLGPLIGAFVEPDEEKMLKKSKKDQMAILSAGVFANVITALIFIFIIWFFLVLMFTEAGVVFNNYAFTVINISSVTSIGSYTIQNPTNESILELIENKELESSLSISSNGEDISLSEIRTGNERYFMGMETLREQLKTSEDVLVVYGDFPAIRAGLKGIIIEFGDVKIKNPEDLVKAMEKYKPADKVAIKTKFNNSVLSYSIELAESPQDKNTPFLGISRVPSFADRFGFTGIIYKFFNLFEDPSIALEPKFNGDLMIFIKNLLWWIIVINFLVALFNMLPLGFLDGGRFFFLSTLAIVKNEKTAKKISKIMAYLILLILILIMFSWFYALLPK